MKFSADLSKFNRRMAEALRQLFAADVHPVQSEDGTLSFRGPDSSGNDPTPVGTHVKISLDKEVIAALGVASPAEREEMTNILIDNLGTQVKTQYNHKLGEYALHVVGTVTILRG